MTELGPRRTGPFPEEKFLWYPGGLDRSQRNDSSGTPEDGTVTRGTIPLVSRRIGPLPEEQFLWYPGGLGRYQRNNSSGIPEDWTRGMTGPVPEEQFLRTGPSGTIPLVMVPEELFEEIA